MNPQESPPELDCSSSPVPGSRRQFLQQTLGLAAGAVLAELPVGAQEAGATSSKPLPTIKLGRHEVSRLIIGGNPIYGFSHFNRILSEYQTNWHTPERVVALLRSAEAHGLNTWQSSYSERMLSDLERYREAGGKMNWLLPGQARLGPEHAVHCRRRAAQTHRYRAARGAGRTSAPPG